MATKTGRRRGSGDGEVDGGLTSGVWDGDGMVRRDGGDAGKCLGRLALAGEAPSDGGELLLLRGSAPTPASNPRRSWARDRGKKGVGESGQQGEASGDRGERRRGRRGLATVVAYLGLGELEEGHGDPRLRGLGPGLLAAYEGEGSGEERQWGGVENAGHGEAIL